jgi:hypothetical protein
MIPAGMLERGKPKQTAPRLTQVSESDIDRCHPGRPHLANAVGDYDCPDAIFPYWAWLKRSLP